MPANIGAKIGVDGEREYRQALSNINQQTKELNSEMALLTSSFDKNASAEDKAAAKSQVLQRQIANQTDKVGMLSERYSKQQSELARLKSEMERATQEFGENSKEAQDAANKYNTFATQTSKTKTELNKAQADLNKMTRELEEAQNPTQEESEAVKDMGKNFGEAGEKGLSFGDILKANVISDVIIGGVKALASAIVSVTKGIAKTVTETVQWADDLATLSVQTGISTDRLQEMEYMANLVDVDVETITGSMAKMTRNMSSAADGSGAAADAFAELGVSVTDADGNLRDSQSVFNDVIDALGALENPTQRDATAMAIFGKSAQELNPLIAAGSDALADYAQEAHDVGYVVGEESLTPLLGMSDALDRINKAGDEIKRTVVAAFSPAFVKALEQIVPAVQEIAKAVGDLLNGDMDLDEFIDMVSGWVSKLGDKLREKLPQIMEQGGKAILALAQGVAQNLPKILQSAGEIVLTLATGIIQATPTLVTSAVNLVISLVNTIAEQAPTLIDAAAKMVTSLVTGLLSSDTITSIVKAGVGLVQAVVRGALDAVPELVKAAPKIVIGLIEGLMESAILVAEAGVELLTALVDSLPEIISVLAESMGELVAGVILALIKLAPKLAEAGVDLFVALIRNAPAIIKAVIMIIPQIVEALMMALINAGPEMAAAGEESLSHLWDHLGDVLEEAKKAGKELIDKLIEGIFSMWSSLKASGREALNQFGKGFKELFPDAYAWGRDMLQNFINGINSMRSALSGAVVGAARIVKNNLGFSEPTEGPLSNFSTYAPDMMKLYAQGIRDNMYMVENAAVQAATGVAGTFAPQSSSVNYGGVNITVNASDEMTAREIADAVMEEMQNAVARREAVYA